jgi:hypothetical protein
MRQRKHENAMASFRQADGKQWLRASVSHPQCSRPSTQLLKVSQISARQLCIIDPLRYTSDSGRHARPAFRRPRSPRLRVVSTKAFPPVFTSMLMQLIV